MSLEQFMSEYGEKYEKWEMVWYLKNKYDLSWQEAQNYYGSWRKAYINSRVDISKVEAKPKKTIEGVVEEYVSRNRIGVSINQIKTFIYYKKLGIKSIRLLESKTGMEERAIMSFYVKLNQAGYKVRDLNEFNFNNISI